MQIDQWLTTQEFEAVWKSSFSDAKSAFERYSDIVSSRSQKERRSGILWRYINQPLPGIHLLDLEFQPSVTPLSIRFNLWINHDEPSLYQKLLNARVPNIMGQPTVLTERSPRPSFKADLASKGISVKGLSFRVSNVSFLHDKARSGAGLRAMGKEFFAWLIRSYLAEEPDTIFLSKTALVPNIGSIAVDPTYPDEVEAGVLYPEGATKLATVNAYERSAAAHQACIDHYGVGCAVCGLKFEERYGEIGRGFIHVHHIVPISEVGGTEYLVDPVKDLRPVCPNCHAMLHRPGSPSIDQLKALLNRT